VILSAYGFRATQRDLDGVRIVAIDGELDIATSPKVRGLLDEAAKDAERPLVVDLTRCAFIDSTGLAALLHGTKPAQNGESHVAVVSPGGEVRKLLELTAIDRTIPVFETVDEAVAAVLSVGG
jgi:anti-sigma B factor antagonist